MEDKFHIVKENHLWKVYNNREKDICIAKTMHLQLMLQKLRTAVWATDAYKRKGIQH